MSNQDSVADRIKRVSQEGSSRQIEQSEQVDEDNDEDDDRLYQESSNVPTALRNFNSKVPPTFQPTIVNEIYDRSNDVSSGRQSRSSPRTSHERIRNVAANSSTKKAELS